jgi:phosphatidate cytidylyltransferase
MQLWLAMQWPAQPWAMAVLPAAATLQFALFWRSKHTDRLLHFLFLVVCAGLFYVVYLHDLQLATGNGAAWFFLLFVVTALNDVGQFIFGKCFGKQKIAQRISPNKTWQGLMGGVLVSMGTALAIGRYLQLAPVGFLLPLGALMSLAGFWGDLSFSAAKRFLGIKDFSNLIPGHGGILDRVDSLVLTAPLLYIALRWFLP